MFVRVGWDAPTGYLRLGYRHRAGQRGPQRGGLVGNARGRPQAAAASTELRLPGAPYSICLRARLMPRGEGDRPVGAERMGCGRMTRGATRAGSGTGSGHKVHHPATVDDSDVVSWDGEGAPLERLDDARGGGLLAAASWKADRCGCGPAAAGGTRPR